MGKRDEKRRQEVKTWKRNQEKIFHEKIIKGRYWKVTYNTRTDMDVIEH